MRCTCCDKLLTEHETAIKWADTRDYADTCEECLATIDREHMAPSKDYVEPEYDEEDLLDMFDEDYWDER